MNIAFMGTPEFAVPSLKILLNSRHKISAVVTVPDKKQGRGQKLTQSDVKKFAVENNLPVIQPEKLKDPEFVNKIKSLNPDLIVVVAFRILPKEIYSIPKYGSINLHASLLPKYRGAAPINRAIMNGEKETGVTAFFLQDKVDTGNIIMQNYCEITEEDDAGTLHDKLMELGALTVYSTVNLIEQSEGRPPVENQDELLATPAPKIFRNDCRIDFNKPAEKVYNFIRGLSPYPAAHIFMKDKMVKIYKASKTPLHFSTPGKILVENERIYIGCSDFMLQINELQPEGKKRMTSQEFLNGYKSMLE